MAPKRLVIGIDLGGTKISTALVDDDGKTIARDYRQTLAAEGPDAIIARMLDAARRVVARADVEPSRVAAAAAALARIG